MANGKIGAVAVTFAMGDVVHILLQRSARCELGTYPNNALTFSMSEQLLKRPEMRTLFYGLRPLAAGDSLDHFKTGMAFRQIAVRATFPACSVPAPICTRGPAAGFLFHSCHSPGIAKELRPERLTTLGNKLSETAKCCWLSPIATHISCSIKSNRSSRKCCKVMSLFKGNWSE